jgi:hypothetical protein
MQFSFDEYRVHALRVLVVLSHFSILPDENRRKVDEGQSFVVPSDSATNDVLMRELL